MKKIRGRGQRYEFFRCEQNKGVVVYYYKLIFKCEGIERI